MQVCEKANRERVGISESGIISGVKVKVLEKLHMKRVNFNCYHTWVRSLVYYGNCHMMMM